MECAYWIQRLKQVLALPVPSDGNDPEKQNKTKICRMGEQKKTLESIWFILIILQVWKLRPQRGHRPSSMSHGELGAEPGWPPSTPGCPLGHLSLCYMVSWVDRQHRTNEKHKKEKRKSRLKTDKTNVYILYEEEDGEGTVP